MAHESGDCKPNLVNYIKEEHVKASLKKDKGSEAELISWKIVDFLGEGENIVSYVTSVIVEYSYLGKSCVTSYVIKLKSSRITGPFESISKGFFMKEVNIFLKLLPELNSVLTDVGEEPLRVPKYFTYVIDEEHFLLFLEDLRQKGFMMRDKTKPMSLDHAILVMKELARVHAASIRLQSKYSLTDLRDRYEFMTDDWITKTGDELEWFEDFFKNHFQNSIALLKHVGGYDRALAWLEKFKDTPLNILQSMCMRTTFDTLCHADCWNNNLLFRYNDEGIPVEVMLIDWQIARVSSLANDINFFVYTCLDHDVRHSNLSCLLEVYYKNLRNLVEEKGNSLPFTLHDLTKEFWDKNPFGLLIAHFIVPLVVKTSEESSKGVEDFIDTNKKDDESIQLMKTNKYFGKRFLAIFDEMTEKGVFE